MRIYHFILMLCCGLVVACDSADPTFPCEETITQELMPLQGVTFPIRVEVKHPFLILQNWKRTDSLFHIYNLVDHKLTNAFGIKGEGPDDFIGPWLFNTQFSDFLISDNPKNQIHAFGVNEEGMPVLKGTKQPSFINRIDDAAFISDSLYVIDPMYTAPSLYLLTLQDELPRKTKQYRNPDIMDYMADPDMGNVYANEKRIVLCYGYKKQIDFMDTDFNLIKRVKFKSSPPPDIINSENQWDVIRCYSTGYLGKRYLYVLFLGKSSKELRNGSSHTFFLEVYDLEGNPVARYLLDGIRPVYFAVDEKTFTLYGAGDDGNPEDYLLMYKLKGL